MPDDVTLLTRYGTALSDALKRIANGDAADPRVLAQRVLFAYGQSPARFVEFARNGRARPAVERADNGWASDLNAVLDQLMAGTGGLRRDGRSGE